MPVVSLSCASLRFGDRVVWDALDFQLHAAEFLAVLGPNGAGKTTLLKVLLGLQRLTSGAVTIDGRRPHRGNSDVGYVPQQRGFDRDLPLRGRDLVRLGLDGHRWAMPFGSRKADRQVQRVLEAVGALGYADAPIGRLSGGEQQRLRVAQALLGDPQLLLCDEPLLSLDLNHQQAVTALLDERRRLAGTALVMVTHEINPVLPLVDRVLYLANGKWLIGTPDEVLTTDSLSELYGAPVDVLRVRGRVVVVGAPDSAHAETGGHHHHPDNGRQ